MRETRQRQRSWITGSQWVGDSSTSSFLTPCPASSAPNFAQGGGPCGCRVRAAWPSTLTPAGGGFWRHVASTHAINGPGAPWPYSKKVWRHCNGELVPDDGPGLLRSLARICGHRLKVPPSRPLSKMMVAVGRTNRVSRGGSAGGGGDGDATPGGKARSGPNQCSEASRPPNDHIVHPDMLGLEAPGHVVLEADFVDSQICRGAPAHILHVNLLDAIDPHGLAAVVLARGVQLDTEDDLLPLAAHQRDLG